MNATRLARLLVRLVTLLVLVSSGAYMVIYLYRWEWNRALISGLLFVAAETTWVGVAIMRRLRAIEDRLDRMAVTSSSPRPARTPATSAPAALQWLDPTRLNVFIPVLMGAGALLSAAAYVVERVSRMVAAPSRSDTAGLGRLGVPNDDGTPVAPSLGAPRSHGRLGAWIVVLAALALLTTAAVNLLADYTKSDREAQLRGGRTDLVLEIGYLDGDRRPPLETARALLEVCRSQLPTVPTITEPVLVAERQVATTIEPALGRLRIRRLTGCLQDATIDRVQAKVISATSYETPVDGPVAPSPPGLTRSVRA
ncbi:MAG: hypothetical protein AB7L13_06130 [Acidimicrobiia bacterium]